MSSEISKDFVGKVVLITGAADGIGSTTAVEFARQGANLSLIDINSQNETIQKCKNLLSDKQILEITGDITNEEICNKYVSDTLAKFGKIDVLVNCAGILLQDSIFTPSLELFDKLIALHLRAMYNLCTICTPHLIKSKGNIVNFSSMVSDCVLIHPKLKVLSYAISKAGVDMLTKYIAAELVPHGVRVNCIRPGPTLTKLVTPEFEFENIAKTDQIASVVLFLASSKASFMTGSVVLCDGGFSVRQQSQH